MAALRRELDARPTMLIAGIIGVLGAIATIVGLAIDPDRAFASYLFAWCTVAIVAVGGLAVLMIGYAANARWPATTRRLAEATAVGVLPTAILIIPLLVWPEHVWPWVHQHRNDYLTLATFIPRAPIYLALFIVPAELLRRWSRHRDDHPLPQVRHGVDAMGHERKLASAFLPIVGLALTFASFDWLMSLQPDWWSSAFGLYIICSALLAGQAMVALLAWRGVASGSIPLTGGHFHALGRLLHAYVILWTYIAYFQAMLIQIANRPDEATFYVLRTSDGWRFVTALLFILTFALPFPLLFPRRLKSRPRYLGGIAVMLLVAHVIDVYWLVIPRVSPTPLPSWTDVAALCALGGLVTAACAWRMHRSPLLPIGDPYLADGLAYETTT
jgi:hypothetical protein